MAGTTGKSLSTWYKDLLKIENSNNGADATARSIFDAHGNETSTAISKDHLQVQPKNSDSTTSFSVRNKNGNTKFLVDTSNNHVQSLGVHNNTQFKNFGVFGVSPTDNTHYAMPMGGTVGNEDSGSADWALTSFGTDVAPAVSLIVSSNAHNITPCLWYLGYTINIDAVRVIASSAGATTLRFSVMKYTLGTGAGEGAGDLSGGALLASNGTPLTTGDDRITTTTLTISTSAVAVNSVILCMVENISTTDDVTATMEVAYHITGT